MEIRSNPQIQANGDLRIICQEIVAKGKSMEEWDRIESDDMFQRGPFTGGYDACEQAFTFSYYDAVKKEWWLSFPYPSPRRLPVEMNTGWIYPSPHERADPAATDNSGELRSPPCLS